MAHVPNWLLSRTSTWGKPCRQPLVREMVPEEDPTNPAKQMILPMVFREMI
jgi:hypothetical protein